MKLVLENNQGQAIRTFLVDGDTAAVVNRRDTRRLEVHRDLDGLHALEVDFDHLGDVTREQMAHAPFKISEDVQLRLVTLVGAVVRDDGAAAENGRVWNMILGLSVFIMLAFLVFVLNRPAETARMEQELTQEMKQRIVQIVRKMPPKPVEEMKTARAKDQPEAKEPSPVTRKTVSVKRLGALSILGSMKNSAQKGGLNLAAVTTTAGPGLGGKQGSGGTQTTLYGKGLVAAPLGAGQNLQGGGGYGTKGKGGGQAGYGAMSLVGSAGSAPIPLGREAVVEGGIDRDLISDVVSRNMGQIRFCYEQGLQGDPGLAGRVAIAFTIGANGQVKTAAVDTTTVNSKVVEDCIVLRLRSWKFPLPTGGVDVKVSYPFVLRRAGQG